MKSRHARLAIFTVILCVLASPLPAQALGIHTLEITGGSMSFTMSPGFGTGDAHWNITGPRITFSAVQSQSNSGSLFRCTLFGQVNCSPGTTLQVGGGGGGGSFLGGSVTLDGVTHGLNGGGNDPRLDGGLNLSLSASVLIPEFGSISSVVLAAPFVLTGTLSRNGLDCINPFVCSGGDLALSTTYQLHGQGVFYGAMHRENRSFSGDYWQTDSARYEFQATPEPATLLLVGTGAAGLGLARWWKRRRKRNPLTM